MGIVLTTVALGLGGCGGSSLSASQLRAGAGRICALAQRQTQRIATPAAPSQESAYLRRGVAALAPELTDLRALHPPDDMAGRYRDALDATDAELRALSATVKHLKDGDDPVVAIRRLAQQLTRPERQAQTAWQSLSIPACLNS